MQSQLLSPRGTRAELTSRSVIDHSRLSDGTPDKETDLKRPKCVRLVQRLKGFVRLVYWTCKFRQPHYDKSEADEIGSSVYRSKYEMPL